MEFKSYAQDCEDIILYCVLKDIEKGFYIDVGANDPEVMSVTKAFYDRGWHGINIEPLHAVCAKLEQERPRDINLCIGCGKDHGQLELYEVGGMSTFSVENATRLKYLDKPKKTRTIWTLAEIYEQYPPPVTIYTFAKLM